MVILTKILEGLPALKNGMSWGLFFLCLLILLAVAFGCWCLVWWIGMMLWNSVLCVVFTSIPTITFWQFAGLEILAGILFKSTINTSSNKE